MHVWTEQSGWRLRGSRSGPDHNHIYTHKYKHKYRTNTRTKNSQIFIPSVPSLPPPLPPLPKNARNPNTSENTNHAGRSGQIHEGCFFECGPVCATTTRSEIPDKTMFGRSEWWRMLARHPFSWRARGLVIPMPATQNCVGSVTTSKQERDGVTRQRQCTRTRSCSGRQRPSARERSSTPLACHVPYVYYCAFAKHVQNVFRSLRCFLKKSTCRHIDVGSKKMLTTPRPQDFLRLPSLLHGRRRVLSVAKFVAVEHN